MTELVRPNSQLNQLLLAYARQPERSRYAVLYAFDERLAQLVRTTTQPMIGQMRLAWWEETLMDPAHVKGAGDPLAGALRDEGIERDPNLRVMLDGWEALLVENAGDEELLQFARGRGAGLFNALAGGADLPSWIGDAGALWSLWDLAGHLPTEDTLRERAISLARNWIGSTDRVKWPKNWKPMRILSTVAQQDIHRGNVPPAGMTPSLYGRVVKIGLIGR